MCLKGATLWTWRTESLFKTPEVKVVDFPRIKSVLQVSHVTSATTEHWEKILCDIIAAYF